MLNKGRRCNVSGLCCVIKVEGQERETPFSRLMEKEVFEKEAQRLRPDLVKRVVSILKNDEETEDVVQETLLKLWFYREHIEEYRSIDILAYVIATRLAFNRRRTMKSASLRTVRFSSSIEVEDDSADIGRDDLPDTLKEALESLPDTEQAVMRLKHLEGMETEEIALLVSSSPEAIRTALSRARKKMKDKFLAGKI